jgi:hypothetical protein
LGIEKQLSKNEIDLNSIHTDVLFVTSDHPIGLVMKEIYDDGEILTAEWKGSECENVRECENSENGVNGNYDNEVVCECCDWH